MRKMLIQSCSFSNENRSITNMFCFDFLKRQSEMDLEQYFP